MTEKPEKLLTIPQVAEKIETSNRHVHNLIAEERIPAPIKMGRLTRFRESEIDEWIAAGCPECATR